MKIVKPNSLNRHAQERAYTMIEVMMAMALLAVASSGIVALQKVTTVGNYQSKNLAIANEISRTWVERLRTDAVSWNYPSPNRPGVASDIAGDTQWLRQVQNNALVWFLPASNPTRGSSAFDVLGNDIAWTNGATPQFCTHLRLSWMYTNSVIRADIRVFWLREGGLGALNGAPFCSAAEAVALDAPGGMPLARYHFVYLSTSISQNTAP